MPLRIPLRDKIPALFFQLVRFAIIGLLASLWHFFTVFQLVEQFSLNPLLANVFAFCSAFMISYLGHSLWTFNDKQHHHRHAVKKFFLVATVGFMINEGGYFLLLAYSPLSYLHALIVVLIFVPIITFILSKYWAFS